MRTNSTTQRSTSLRSKQRGVLVKPLSNFCDHTQSGRTPRARNPQSRFDRSTISPRPSDVSPPNYRGAKLLEPLSHRLCADARHADRSQVGVFRIHLGTIRHSQKDGVERPAEDRSKSLRQPYGDSPIHRLSIGKSLPMAVGGSVAAISGTALMIVLTNVFELGPGQAR